MCFLEVAGWKDQYQIHQLPPIDTSQRDMGDTTTQCCLPLSSTPCTLHKRERAANGEDLQRTRDSWSPGSDKQVLVISTSYCMILHKQLSACAQKQNKSSEALKQILAHTMQGIIICDICMQQRKCLKIQITMEATGNTSQMQDMFLSHILEIFIHVNSAESL